MKKLLKTTITLAAIGVAVKVIKKRKHVISESTFDAEVLNIKNIKNSHDSHV